MQAFEDIVTAVKMNKCHSGREMKRRRGCGRMKKIQIEKQKLQAVLPAEKSFSLSLSLYDFLKRAQAPESQNQLWSPHSAIHSLHVPGKVTLSVSLHIVKWK